MNLPVTIELEARLEATNRAPLDLTASLEERALIDGPRFSQGLRETRTRGNALRDRAHQLLCQLADQLDEARQVRHDLRESLRRSGHPQ